MSKIHVGNGIVYASLIKAATTTPIGAALITAPIVLGAVALAGAIAWDNLVAPGIKQAEQDELRKAINAEISVIADKPKVVDLVQPVVRVSSDYFDPYAAKNKGLSSNQWSDDGRLVVLTRQGKVDDGSRIPANETDKINKTIDYMVERACNWIYLGGHQVCNVIATGRQPYKLTVTAAKVKEIQAAEVKAKQDAAKLVERQKLQAEQAKRDEIAKDIAETEAKRKAEREAYEADTKARQAKWEAEQEAETKRQIIKNKAEDEKRNREAIAECIANGQCDSNGENKFLKQQILADKKRMREYDKDIRDLGIIARKLLNAR